MSRAVPCEAKRAAAQHALGRLIAALDEGRSPAFLALPERIDDREVLEREAAIMRARFRHLVVLGTGGSSLGAQAIVGALAPGGVQGGRRITFLDNVDPDGVARAFDALDLDETGFLAISKSGSTPETLAQAMLALERVKRRVGPARAGQHFAAIVEPGDSPLRRLAGQIGAPALDHDPALGGRFSVLSLVGLVPALYLGLDAWGLRAGAAAAINEARNATEAAPHPVAEAAAQLVGSNEASGVGSVVLMGYGDALRAYGQWWRQLVAESLGKDGKGFTTLLARGTTDQHSQLQLYLAGPADKSFIVLGPARREAGERIAPKLAAALGIAYLGGRSLDELFAAEADATAAALAEAGRPVRRIALEALNARTLGGLFMNAMLEVVVIATLIGVNPYDQPAVERGKRLARERLEGYA
ncbi:MAG: glucose-6-phosphate isomerase [Alphaproteobacteria bacterium]